MTPINDSNFRRIFTCFNIVLLGSGLQLNPSVGAAQSRSTASILKRIQHASTFEDLSVRTREIAFRGEIASRIVKLAATPTQNLIVADRQSGDEAQRMGALLQLRPAPRRIER